MPDVCGPAEAGRLDPEVICGYGARLELEVLFDNGALEAGLEVAAAGLTIAPLDLEEIEFVSGAVTLVENDTPLEPGVMVIGTPAVSVVVSSPLVEDSTS